MEDFVTSGCIPCELRRLFVEALHNNAESTAKTGISVGGQLASAQEGTTVKSLDNVGGTGFTNNGQAVLEGGTANSPPTQPQVGIVTTKKYIRQYPPLVPSKFLFSVWTFADHMAGYEQQDAHEFMIALLDGIETHLRKYHSPPPLPSPSSLANKHDRNGNRMAVEGTVEDEVVNYKVVSNLFSGLLESEVRCAHCGCISTTTEPFLDLSLSLDQALRLPGKEHIQGVSLQTCIDDYATAESLSTPIYCENCKEHRKALKSLVFGSLRRY